MSGIVCMTGVVETSGKNFWDKPKKVGVDNVEVWIPSVLYIANEGQDSVRICV